MTRITHALMKAIADLPVIDAHEHLWPEEYHLAHEQDVLTLLQYSLADLEVAGASPEEVRLLQSHREGPKASLEQRWGIFREYLPLIRDTAPIRALFIALRDLYGVRELDDATVHTASEKIRAARTPGLYDRVLKERCKITGVLNQNPDCRQSDGFLLPIRSLNETLGPLHSRAGIEALGEETGRPIANLDDAVASVSALFDRWQADGTIGVKRAGTALSDPSREEAAAALDKVLEAGEFTPSSLPLQHFLEHWCIEEAGKRDMPVSVHTGLWAGTWADIRRAHPENLIDIALKHRDTRFDVFHAGIPWVSTVGIMARQCPNLWLNLCWCHVISPVLSRRALSEWLDTVPVTKIIAWGGDYWMAVEKVYGHLVMARENIAEVLAERMDRGLCTETRAIEMARMMFHDNAQALYGLD